MLIGFDGSSRNGIVSMNAAIAFCSAAQSNTKGSCRRDSTRFSATVIASTSVKCWYTMPIPSPAASRGLVMRAGMPPTLIRPASAW